MGLRAEVKVKIDDGKIAGLLARVHQAVYDGVADGADLIKVEAQIIVPIDTSLLHDSIEVDMAHGIRQMKSGGGISSSSMAITASIAPHTDYAAYVEYGTGQRGAASAGAGEGPYSESWPGMAAQPYMRPAYDQNKEHVADLIKVAVMDAIK